MDTEPKKFFEVQIFLQQSLKHLQNQKPGEKHPNPYAKNLALEIFDYFFY